MEGCPKEGRAGEKWGWCARVTGQRQICPDGVYCGNKIMPTAIEGTPCAGPCRKFEQGSWCCTGADGCPGGGSSTEMWGWCREFPQPCKTVFDFPGSPCLRHKTGAPAIHNMGTFINAAGMLGSEHHSSKHRSGFDYDHFVAKCVKNTAYKQTGGWEKADRRNVNTMIRRCQKATRRAMKEIARATTSHMHLDIGRKIRVIRYLVRRMTQNINFGFGKPMQPKGHLIQEVGPVYLNLGERLPFSKKASMSATLGLVREAACKMLDLTENFCFVKVSVRARPWLRVEFTRGYFTDNLQQLNGPLEAFQLWVRFHQKRFKHLAGYLINDIQLTRPHVKPPVHVKKPPHSHPKLPPPAAHRTRSPLPPRTMSPTIHGHRCTQNPSFEDDAVSRKEFQFLTPKLWHAQGDVAIVQSGNQAFGGTRIGALKAPRGQNYCALQGKGTYIKQQVAGEGSSMIVQFYASARDGYAPAKLGVYVDGRSIVDPIVPGIGWKKHTVHIQLTMGAQSVSLEFRNDGGRGFHSDGDVTVFLDGIDIIGGACKFTGPRHPKGHSHLLGG